MIDVIRNDFLYYNIAFRLQNNLEQYSLQTNALEIA